MNTCSTCVHFHQRMRDSIREAGFSLDMGHPVLLVSRCGHDEAAFIVHDPPPDFGCKYHEPRTPSAEPPESNA